VLDAPTFSDVAAEFAELLQDRVFAAHNASFDLRFLQAEFERAGYWLGGGTPACLQDDSRLEVRARRVIFPVARLHHLRHRYRTRAQRGRRLVRRRATAGGFPRSEQHAA
jgi:DNA polymerase III epsilon subunit-like protein